MLQICFSNKANGKRLLKQHFTENKDYKITLIRSDERVHGGQNLETIMINVNTFKKLCLKNNIEKQLLRTEKLGGSGILQEDIMLNVDTFKNLFLRLEVKKKKQFNGLNIQVYGTYDEPLFKAKDIGDLLEIKDIRTTLRDFDKDEWHSMPVTVRKG